MSEQPQPTQTIEEELTSIRDRLEELGGRTRYTEHREYAATPDELEEDDHIA